ncbi:DUF2474 domain-containing protein [Paracoccus sp. 11-3]|uniref:DUF2474 domain-containing protein n=1 Tax=Paracoccus amoyensis TaxID=2760093 RepID=A0A926GBE3_9RHOB|nr:DUF2474 domain-containing protein [Paracoccus amoyensis]MBC9246876.1 DUF2474 domain-containing protein [Paracoccus amoyensis]
MAGSNAPFNLWLRRIGWLIAIWAGSIAVLAVIAFIFRILMKFAGLTA